MRENYAHNSYFFDFSLSEMKRACNYQSWKMFWYVCALGVSKVRYKWYTQKDEMELCIDKYTVGAIICTKTQTNFFFSLQWRTFIDYYSCFLLCYFDSDLCIQTRPGAYYMWFSIRWTIGHRAYLKRYTRTNH